MNMQNPSKRITILARMLVKAPQQTLGRTQVMKLIYFLQELKRVDLGYDFRLFNYGPFDSDVLSDLGTATSDNVVKEVTKIYARGYGYEITPNARAYHFAEDLATSDSDLAAKVDEVISEFGSFSAAELELRSTILFVDREFLESGTLTSSSNLADRVRQIKPHFCIGTILDRVNEMYGMGWLRSIRN
jgi:uncharacterized protein